MGHSCIYYIRVVLFIDLKAGCLISDLLFEAVGYFLKAGLICVEQVTTHGLNPTNVFIISLLAHIKVAPFHYRKNITKTYVSLCWFKYFHCLHGLSKIINLSIQFMTHNQALTYHLF